MSKKNTKQLRQDAAAAPGETSGGELNEAELSETQPGGRRLSLFLSCFLISAAKEPLNSVALRDPRHLLICTTAVTLFYSGGGGVKAQFLQRRRHQIHRKQLIREFRLCSGLGRSQTGSGGAGGRV